MSTRTEPSSQSSTASGGGGPSLVSRLLRVNVVAVVILALLFLFMPQLVPISIIPVFTLANIYAMFAASWDILSGYTGQVNFGHAAFIGTGGFVVGLLFRFPAGNDLPVELRLLAGTVLAALLGLLIGIPCLRLSGPYLALATLASANALVQLTFVFKEQTGGEDGISGLPRLADSAVLGPIGEGLGRVALLGTWGDLRPFDQDIIINYAIVAVITLLMVGGLYRLGESRQGLVLRSIQQDSSAAEAAGVPIVRYKIAAFVLSAGCAGLAGGLLATTRGSVNIDLLFVDLSLIIIAIAAIGGVGSILGPAVGAYLVIFLEEQFLDQLGFVADEPNYKPLLFALALILVLLVQPKGLIGPLLQKMRRRTAEREGAAMAAAMAGQGAAARDSSDVADPDSSTTRGS
jgi:branched-chain amino acid transport system permease protein